MRTSCSRCSASSRSCRSSWYDLGPSFVYVALKSADEVAALKPNFQELLAFEPGVYCFAPLDGRWKARMFAPGSGVAEDPATGSAAGPFAVHLLRHGRIASGEEIEIEQGAELRRAVAAVRARDRHRRRDRARRGRRQRGRRRARRVPPALVRHRPGDAADVEQSDLALVHRGEGV